MENEEDGAYRYFDDEERELWDGFWQVAEGHSGDTVTAVCICFLSTVWKARPPEVVATSEEFLGACLRMLKQNLEIPSQDRKH